MKRTLMTIAILASLTSVPLMTVRAATQCAANHVVLPGENLFRIGLRYGLQWPAIASANGIADPRTLKAGQVLCIPAVLAGTTPATPTPVPTPTGAPLPTPAPVLKVPTITIVTVVRDQSVTVSAVNFPRNQTFDVRMGPIGTKGIDGTQAGTQNSGTGVFTGTYNIPAGLKGSELISIRLESSSGFFSYNWFINRSTP